MARRTQPGYTHCFLAALNEVVRGSQQEGAVVDEWSGAHADRIKALAAEVEAAEEAKAEAAASAHSSTAAGSAQEGEGSEDASAAEYFMLRAERRKALAGRPGGVDISEEVDPSAAASDDDGFREQRVLLTGADMDELDERFRRLHSAAVLAESAADAAAPLAASEDLRSALTALAVLQGALATLQRTTAALERDDAVRDECGSKVRPLPSDPLIHGPALPWPSTET